ncbi:MAG: peroxiredoxin [Desulfomonilaceae bacterium]|jgi:peroxiredoxin (alkyl hydroperoxide reductase subunit C)
MRKIQSVVVVMSFIGLWQLLALSLSWGASVPADSSIYDPGKLKAIDSSTKLKAGDIAPDFSLPTLSGGPITLSQYLNKKNVVLSFVPAAWTPVCSQQWPGYNIAKDLFDKYDAQLIGISVDNIPTLHAWTKEMGDLWFPVASDFWPHGAVAKKYGILRSNGVSERALFVIDKKGVIRYVDVHDINSMPKLENLIKELKKL